MFEIWKDIEGYEEYYQVSNLGKVKSIRNNHINNLEWNTYSENIRHAYKMGLMKPPTNKPMLGKFGKDHHSSIAVKCFFLLNEFIKQYESAEEASKKTNVSPSNIARVCKGKRKTAGGFIWRYA